MKKENIFDAESIRGIEERFRAVVEATTDCILVWDVNYNYVYANQAAIEHVGVTRDKVAGKNMREGLGHLPEFMKLWMKRVDRVVRTGRPMRVEDAGMVGNRFVYSQSTVSPIRNGEGKIWAVGVVYRDVTEIKKSQEKLKVSEQRYKELWDDAPVAYHTLDANGIITSVNRTETRMLGYRGAEMVGRPVFNFILPEQRREAKERFRRKLAGENLPKADDRIYVKKDGSRVHVSIEDKFERDGDRIIGVKSTMVNISALKQAETAQKQGFEKLQKTLDGTVSALGTISELRDPYTAGHQRWVAQLSCAIAREMGISENGIEGIELAGLLHDAGKIVVPAEILVKPGFLSEYEMGIMRTHPQVGYDLLKGIEFPWPIATIVLQHHERLNGSGYPGGISGNDILLEAKILAVADTVEAMASHRPYRPALGIGKALNEIAKNKGVLYEKKVANACIRVFSERKFKFKVR